MPDGFAKAQPGNEITSEYRCNQFNDLSIYGLQHNQVWVFEKTFPLTFLQSCSKLRFQIFKDIFDVHLASIGRNLQEKIKLSTDFLNLLYPIIHRSSVGILREEFSKGEEILIN